MKYLYHHNPCYIETCNSYCTPPYPSRLFKRHFTTCSKPSNSCTSDQKEISFFDAIIETTRQLMIYDVNVFCINKITKGRKSLDRQQNDIGNINIAFDVVTMKLYAQLL